MSPQELHNITTVIDALVLIKWGIVSMAVSLWGMTAYFLLKEALVWWGSFDVKKKRKKPFTLGQMRKDLEESTRVRK